MTLARVLQNVDAVRRELPIGRHDEGALHRVARLAGREHVGQQAPDERRTLARTEERRQP